MSAPVRRRQERKAAPKPKNCPYALVGLGDTQTDWMLTIGYDLASDDCKAQMESFRLKINLPGWARCITFQEELGGESGYRHWQVYVRMKRACKLLHVKDCFKAHHAHVEHCRDPAAAEKYCRKAETRAPGNTFYCLGDAWFGTKQPGRRTDMHVIKDMLCAGVGAREVFNAFPGQMIRYGAGIERCRALLEEPRNNHYLSKGIVLWGSTRMGKSEWAKHHYPNAYIKSGADDWWPRYNGQTEVIIEEYRGYHVVDDRHVKCMTQAFILEMMNSGAVSVPFKGGYRELQADTFIFTSNRHPENWWPGLDQKSLDAFMERCSPANGGMIKYMDDDPFAHVPRWGATESAAGDAAVPERDVAVHQGGREVVDLTQDDEPAALVGREYLPFEDSEAEDEDADEKLALDDDEPEAKRPCPPAPRLAGRHLSRVPLAVPPIPSAAANIWEYRGQRIPASPELGRGLSPISPPILRRGPTEHALMFDSVLNSCHLGLDVVGGDAPASQADAEALELLQLEDSQVANRRAVAEDVELLSARATEDAYAQFERDEEKMMERERQLRDGYDDREELDSMSQVAGFNTDVDQCMWAGQFGDGDVVPSSQPEELYTFMESQMQ